MRHIPRKPLSDDALAALGKFQGEANLLAPNDQKINSLWSAKRKTKAFNPVKSKLGEMAGSTKRCMYCEDSVGTDIEHFWPKSAYPQKMFHWDNYLLSCSGCNLAKGEEFPVDSGGNPVLIDPMVDDPWNFLDFDPMLSQITARFDLAANCFSYRGQETVRILELNNREPLEEVYGRTYLRIRECLEALLQSSNLESTLIASKLSSLDDHHLLGWCFIGAGQNVSPWKEFQEQHSDVWEECKNILFPAKG